MAATTKQEFSGTGIACARGERVLFQNLSFRLAPGAVLHVAGPNGAGKTSLLRIMCGALPMEAGKILWRGNDFLENGLPAHAARFSFLPASEAGLRPLETAGENLRFWAGLWRLGADRPAAALEQVDMVALRDTPARHLSAGQRRRLSLARALLRPAPLWLFDEPLNGLDARAYDLFMAVLDAHCANGGMAAIASHYALEPPRNGQLSRLEVGYA